jgi:hypothetical protein
MGDDYKQQYGTYLESLRLYTTKYMPCRGGREREDKKKGKRGGGEENDRGGERRV